MADNLVPILSPDGQPGTIPSEQLADALGQGFSLPRAQLQKEDLTPNQKGVNVFSPDGVQGIIPLEQLHPAMQSGYIPISQTTPEEIKAHSERVKRDLDAIQNISHLEPFAANDLFKTTHPNSFYDEQGNLRLKTLDGQDLALPAQDALPLLAAHQVKIADPDNASLLEAFKQYNDQYGSIIGSLGGFAQSPAVLGGAGPSVARGLSKFGGPVDQAAYLADTLITAEHPTAAKIGYAVGLPALAASPEMELGSMAKAATVAKLAPEGAGIARTIAAETLGGALEGAIITTPQALAQIAIDKNPKAAAESIGLGLALGGTFGFGGGLVRGAGEAINAAKITAVDDGLRELGLSENMIGKIGSAEAKEKFVNTLIDDGITDKSRVGKIEEVLQKEAEGQHLQPILEKLDPYLPNPIKADPLAAKIAAIGSEVASIEPKAVGHIEELSQKLASYTDKNGKISLQDLGKFVQDVGEDINWRARGKGDIINGMKKKIQEQAMTTMMSAADEAAALGGGKLADAWLQNKYVAEISKQLHTKLVEPVVDTGVAVPGVFKTGEERVSHLIKHVVGHWLRHKVATGIGAAVGSHLGPLGTILGAAGGYAASKITSNLVERIASNPEGFSTAGKFLSSRANNPAIASYIALDALHSVQKKIDQIPDFITTMGKRTIIKSAQFASQEDPIKQILGSEANGLSKDQQFAKLMTQINTMAGNQELRQTHTAQAASVFANDHTALASQLQQELDQKIMWLHSIAPKTSSLPPAFQKEEERQPTAQEKAEFLELLKVAENPFILLDNLKDGKVTPKQVAVAAQLNPEILNMIRDKMFESAYSGNADLTYQQRLSASIIMAQAMDPTIAKIQNLQSVYGTNSQANQPSDPPPNHKSGKGGSHLNQDKMPGAQYTPSQRQTK
jgi:hypothetical protein